MTYREEAQMSKQTEELQKILALVDQYIATHMEKEQSSGEWINYSGPHFDSAEYVAAVEQLLSGWLIFGKNARKFELEFPAHLDTKHGVLTNSGSSANLLMVAALKSKNLYNLPEGSKILTPVVCFPTTINPIIQNGFKPVFVDVTLPDLNLDLDQVEKILEADTNQEIKAIMFAHVLGNPPNMDRVMKIVEKYNLILLEDCCDALGSTYDGKRLGSFGHISTCSFFPAHHMTMGEGGFVTTNDWKARKVIASLRDWGRACYCNTKKPGNVTAGTACGNRFKNWLPGMKDTTYDHRYVFDEIGYNMKPIDMQAAIGLQQLKKLPDLDAARRKNFKRLTEIFKPYSAYFHLPKATKKADPCWFAYLLTIKESAPFTRDDIVTHLEQAKIQTRSYFSGNILAHPGYYHMAEEHGDLHKVFPVAKLVTANSFFLGTYIGLTNDKMNYIEETINKFFESHGGLK
jgi:CDP-6-deoxy-D-xylo-4-hexulose-3-dehydrase